MGGPPSNPDWLFQGHLLLPSTTHPGQHIQWGNSWGAINLLQAHSLPTLQGITSLGLATTCSKFLRLTTPLFLQIENKSKNSKFIFHNNYNYLPFFEYLTINLQLDLVYNIQNTTKSQVESCPALLSSLLCVTESSGPFSGVRRLQGSKVEINSRVHEENKHLIY